MQDNYADDLYGLLIPLAEERLLLPRVTVAEVITWQAPEKSEGTPAWHLGLIQWNGRPIPVISFEAMCGQAFPAPGGRTRIAVLVAIGEQITGGYFGVVTQGFPQLVRANSDVIKSELNHSFSDRSPIICRVRMLNESPLIPDLFRVEEMIGEETRAA
ncbi:MAG TPA: chemotaxis protein CheW [Steroidobacteraceae bacterium]|nr:chemotaxis protein CheW [Steroidobacteraceae bacterium]